MDIKSTQKFSTLKELKAELVNRGLAKNMAEAEKVARRIVPQETSFQAAIIKRLRKIPGAFVWKEQAGPFQTKGLPDVCAIIGGRLFGFEVKRPFFGEPTDVQKQIHEQMRTAGACVAVVTYVEEVEAILEREGIA